MAKIYIKSEIKMDYSSEYFCIHSIQRLNSEFDTNVFTSNIPISQLLKNRDIMLVDDLKGDARWGMNKIIQRNISTKRVEEIKNEYLGSQNRAIKFFPSITVILLPKTHGEPKQQYTESKESFDNIAGIFIERLYDGDIFLHNYPVQLKWDKKEISALVIDGQHRVSAIREFYESKNEKTYRDISIPVTFVVFKNSENLDLIQATRALFIDVNNTPRLVSEEKLIFIDDRNIHRRITAQTFGANNPGEEEEDVYQKMLDEEDFLINSENFISRYFIEESGKDDEETRGFLRNHRTLFPWEISNIMTIHRNILGNILLQYKEVDKSRDIRSICFQLNNVILEEIDNAESTQEISEKKLNHLRERLENGGLTNSEIEVFNNLIRIKNKNIEEIQEAEGEFLVGSIASEEEEKEKKDFINLLQNIYNQDCSKDSAFETSAAKITEILQGRCSIYIKLLTKVFNNLWFTLQIKNSILEYAGEDRKLIFNFIINTHESLKSDNNIRGKSDRVQKQINSFLSDAEDDTTERKKKLNEWAKKLEESQNCNLLRTVVGQEMLFLFIISQNTKLNSLNLDDLIQSINTLGQKKFFESDYKIEINFFNKPEFKILDFNQWSEIIMKGDTMKPGITNATKGANLITAIVSNISNRNNASANLRLLDRLQKSYGVEIINKFTNEDPGKLFFMYEVAKVSTTLSNYITQNDIDTISEVFNSFEEITPKAKNVLIKLYGGIALEQVVNHFKLR